MADNGGSFSNLVTVLQNIAKAIGQANQTIGKVFPISSGTATTATSGAATLPSQPAGFILVTNPTTGATVKVAFYNQ